MSALLLQQVRATRTQPISCLYQVVFPARNPSFALSRLPCCDTSALVACCIVYDVKELYLLDTSKADRWFKSDVGFAALFQLLFGTAVQALSLE
jgi:hypothetical protein